MGNQHGKDRRDYDRRTYWSNAECPSPPGKPYLAPDAREKQADVITIRWSPPSSNGGAPIIGYLVEHRRTGSPHWLRATPHLVSDTKLPLTGLEPGWRYQFRVSAENGAGVSEPSELSEPLTVTAQKWAVSAPFFNVELQDQCGLENEKVEFKVHVIGVPTPTISWYKDGFEVFSSRRTKIVTEDDHSVFIIHQAALEDEGEIKCTATNRAGHAVTKANLKLEAPPRIRLPRLYEDGLIFEKGEPIRLKVTVAGRPKPHVTWYHNGEVVRRSERLEILDSKTGSMLKIADACRSDRGEYGIVGINKIGEDSTSILVTVTDRPSPPGKVQVKAFERKVKLAWFSPNDDGGCKIGTYIVEYFRVGWDMWLKARNSRQLTTSLENLIEGSEYKFRVRAENPYGISDPSEESDIVFIPDPKRGIYQPSSLPKTTPAVHELKRHAELDEMQRNETEEAKRRRLLEEKARKLLDTPLSELLPYENEKAEKRKSESIPDTITFAISDENMPPSLPRRKNKGKKRLNLNATKSDLDMRQNLTPSPGEKASSSNELRIEIQMPEETKKSNTNYETNQKLNLDKDRAFRIESPLFPRETDDSDIHGSSELMLVIYPRDRSKSIELSAQHRSEIEMNLKAEGTAPPLSLSSPELGFAENFELPRLRNAVSSTELLHERTAARLYQDSIEEELQQTVKRRFSMDRKSTERRSSKTESILERRLSFREKIGQENVQEFQKPTEKENELVVQKVSLSIPVSTEKLQVDRERLSSVEKERLEFAEIRERLRKREEEKRLRGNSTPRHYQLSDTTTTTSSSLQTDDIDEEEDFEFLRRDESIHSEEEREFAHILKLRASNLEPRRKLAPLAQDENETYNPRSKVPIRSHFVSVEKETESDTSSVTQSSSIGEESKKKSSKIFKKFSLKRDKKIPQVTETDPNAPPPPKPILKNKVPMKCKMSTVKRLIPNKAAEKSVSEEESESELSGKKKKVRITEPKMEEEADKPTEKEIDQNAVENQVLIYHYSDILKEFGGHNRPKNRPQISHEKKTNARTHIINAAMESKTAHSAVAPTTGKQSVEVEELTPKAGADSSKEIREQRKAKEVFSSSSERMHGTLEYLVDVAMFLLACWLYFFKNELYAIPILCIMAYRQLKDLAVQNYQILKEKFKNK